jgi:hypothetical protein
MKPLARLRLQVICRSLLQLLLQLLLLLSRLKKKRRDGLQICLAGLKQNVLDLEQCEKASEAVPSEALQKASEAGPSEALASVAAPNARVLPGNKSIIIFVFF